MSVLAPLKEVICSHAYDISYERYQLIDARIRDDPAFHLDFSRYNLTQRERQEKSDDVMLAIDRLAVEMQLTRVEKLVVYSRLNQFSDGYKALELIRNSLIQIASQEQADYWVPKIESCKIHVGYAMTELGTGTDVGKLQTTAYFNSYTREFIINSPSLTSFKWWIGSSEYVTHVILFAQMYVDGKREGLMPFIFQIRDLNTLEFLPGARAGPIGPNAGVELQNYSYFIFSNMRVPYSALLQRFVSISPEGKLVLRYPDSKQLVMSGLHFLRTLLSSWSWRPAALALTITVRYSEVRRQFSTQDGTNDERKVLDYQLQQYKLIPSIASCFAQLFAGKHLFNLFHAYNEASFRGDFSLATEISTLSTCTKTFYTWTTLKNLEVCRRACGGHGYSAYSGIPILFLNYMPTVTFEGDNTVMALVTGKSLLGIFERLQAGKSVKGDFGFFVNEAPLSKDFLSADFGLNFFGRLTTVLASSLQRRVEALVQSGYKKSDAQTALSQSLIELAKAFNRHFTSKGFLLSVSAVTDPETRRLLELLREVYVVIEALELGNAALREGILEIADIKQLKACIPELFKALRPHLLTIMNSFDFSDSFLCSALGRQDGNVYEALLNLAKGNPVNQTQPHPFILKHVKPLAKL
mmetsp:Transcript_28688/g.51071  ORF Transcript_28688/g.51071 Transcript_28688/m.51071 type:complete len:639 (-) Transcript_28688:121-2037(-)